MFWIAALAFLGLYFTVTSYSDGKENLAILWFEITLVISAIAFIVHKEEKKSRNFLNWLVSNAVNVRNRTALYDGKPIKPDTEITQFQACFSFIILTTKAPSRFFIRRHDNTILMGTAFTFITLIFGWWGIPWGPIYTLETLYRNARGGHKQTVNDMLVKIETATIEMEKKEQESKVHSA